MPAYVLRIIDQETGPLRDGSATADRFDYLFEVLEGPFAGQWGTHQYLSELVGENVLVLSTRVGICHETGALLDLIEGDDGRLHWLPRRDRQLERAVGAGS